MIIEIYAPGKKNAESHPTCIGLHVVSRIVRMRPRRLLVHKVGGTVF